MGALGPLGLRVLTREGKEAGAHGQEEGPELEKEAETPRNHPALWGECITELVGETELEH